MPRPAVSPLQTSLFTKQQVAAQGPVISPAVERKGPDTAETRTLTISDLVGRDGRCLYADVCEGCGRLHGGDCPAPVTEPPECLFDAASGDEEGLTPLGEVVQEAARYLEMRGWLDGEWPDWLLADLAELAREPACSTRCRAREDGLLNPSDIADHFTTRRREEWERWLPVWSCACGMTFKVNREEANGAAFYEARPDGLMGDLAGCVTADARGNVKESGACPGCGRLFADSVAGSPVTPQPKRSQAPGEPAPTLF